MLYIDCSSQGFELKVNVSIVKALCEKISFQIPPSSFRSHEDTSLIRCDKAQGVDSPTLWSLCSC